MSTDKHLNCFQLSLMCRYFAALFLTVANLTYLSCLYHLLFVYNVCFVGLYVSIATVCGEQINRAF